MNAKLGILNVVTDDELDAVVGGMMNNGQGNFLQMPKNSGGGSNTGKDIFDTILGIGAAAVVLAAFFG